MRPYVGKYSEEKQNVFNYRLSRASKWLKTHLAFLLKGGGVNTSIVLCDKIMMTCVVLYNYIQKGGRIHLFNSLKNKRYCPTGFVDSLGEGLTYLTSEGRLVVNNSTTSKKLLKKYTGWLIVEEIYFYYSSN